SRRFSSSLLMSIRQPVSFAASRTFCPFLPIASDSCLSSTTTSITRSRSSTIDTRCTFAGLSPLVTNAVGSSDHSTMSIFSPRSLADFLKDDLFVRLCCNAAEHFSRLRELHLVAKLDAVCDIVAVHLPVHLPRVVDRDLCSRRRDVLYHRFEGEQIDLTRFHI